MNRSDWFERIKCDAIEAGTYRPFFDSIIDTLADVMAMRDDALQKFVDAGGETVVTHVNKGGAANIVKNPALVVVDDLNKTALAYWRDLGLTPAGLKRINESAMKERGNKASFGDILKDLDL